MTCMARIYAEAMTRECFETFQHGNYGNSS